LFLLAPILLALGGALVLSVGPPVSDSRQPPLTFTLGDQRVTAPIDLALIRRRTITPEFDPPLELLAGRLVFARGFIACDPGEVFVVDVTLTQDEASGSGRTAGRCSGETQVWTAIVVTRSGEFVEGPAEACAQATTRRAGVTDTFEWCGSPTLASAS
jgi:hypothetical protein